jgi:transposase
VVPLVPETSPVVKANHAISTGVAEYALKLSKQSLPVKTIASITGVSTSSIQRIIDDTIKPKPMNYLPTSLCFDEFRSTQSQMSFICSDADTHKAIVVMGDWLSVKINQFFYSHYSRDQRARVNRKIKALKRSCYGFINQAHMFKRIYQLIA